MEPSRKSHAIGLRFFSVAQCQNDDAIESVATHSSRLQPTIISMPQLVTINMLFHFILNIPMIWSPVNCYPFK